MSLNDSPLWACGFIHCTCLPLSCPSNCKLTSGNLHDLNAQKLGESEHWSILSAVNDQLVLSPHHEQRIVLLVKRKKIGMPVLANNIRQIDLIRMASVARSTWYDVLIKSQIIVPRSFVIKNLCWFVFPQWQTARDVALWDWVNAWPRLYVVHVLYFTEHSGTNKSSDQVI